MSSPTKASQGEAYLAQQVIAGAPAAITVLSSLSQQFLALQEHVLFLQGIYGTAMKITSDVKHAR